MRHRLKALIIAAGVFAFAAATPPQSAAQEQTRTYHIPPQPLASALDEFARQSGRDILFSTQVSAGRRSAPVGGALTAEEALRMLLSSAALSFRVVDGETFVIEAQSVRSGAIEPASVRSEEIVVQANLRRTARSFAAAIATAPRTNFPRWSAPICVSVAGLEASDAQRLIDHMARRAHEAGAAIATAGCSANVVVIFAQDSDRVAAEVARSQRRQLDTAGGDVWRRGYAEFTAPGQPVRWWRAVARAGLDGSFAEDEPARRQAMVRPVTRTPENVMSDAISGAGVVRSEATRMRSATHHELAFALIVVDGRRTAAADRAAVADFVAMTALAPVSADADMSAFSTILNLFAAPADPPRGLTSWDIAYLRGLYRAPATAASSRAHARQIADLMSGALTPEGEGP